MDSKYAKKASVSTQKSHSGRSGADAAEKNSAAPPTSPSSTYSRSCPSARRSVNRNSESPAAAQ